jgi:hypothetical protein
MDCEKDFRQRVLWAVTDHDAHFAGQSAAPAVTKSTDRYTEAEESMASVRKWLSVRPGKFLSRKTENSVD